MNSTNIEANATKIRENSAELDRHEHNLEVLDADRQAMAEVIGLNSEIVDLNSTNIEANATKIRENSAELDRHEHNLEVLDADRQVMAKAIERNGAHIDAHEQVLARHETAITANTERMNAFDNRVSGLESRVGKLDRKVDGFMAQSAAQANLVLPYTVGKTAISLATGTSGRAVAFAVGAGRRINDAFSARAGIAYDNMSRRVTAGVGVGFEF
ncbi:Adhesin YadA [Pandoraea sputorum]|uniref:Adhesin YadA n=1 Tax=Pandoraea sputorum TaxID=93222 RepID=A0A5E5BL34_9BURK|nr:Adhesin YadA [Pandoraea sputorum]